MLLKRMTLWMAHAATYLQRCHHVMQQESASTAYMEGLGAELALDNIAQARQALQVLLNVSSAFKHAQSISVNLLQHIHLLHVNGPNRGSDSQCQTHWQSCCINALQQSKLSCTKLNMQTFVYDTEQTSVA